MSDQPEVICTCRKCGSTRFCEVRREDISYRVERWGFSPEDGLFADDYGKQDCMESEHLRFYCWECDATLTQADIKVEVGGVEVQRQEVGT